MTAVGLLWVALFAVVALAGGLLLYAGVRAERGQRQVMDRGAAEQVARRDTDDEDDRTAGAARTDHRSGRKDASEFGREK